MMRWGVAQGIVILMGAMMPGCSGGRGPLMLTEQERASVGPLCVGDAAPPLAIAEWVKGEPVDRFEPGRVYVIDFWATWCGPCIASMGRTSALQEKHPGRVTVIAVTTEDRANTAARIRQHVKKDGARMRFRVAIDRDARTADAYRRASRESAIPRSFLVDQNGRLAWIGHPAQAEPVVERMLAGTWDLAAAAKDRTAAVSARAEARRCADALRAAERTGDNGAKLAALERLCSISPEENNWSPPHAPWMVRADLLREMGRSAEVGPVLEQMLAMFPNDPTAQAEGASGLVGIDAARAGEIADKAGSLLRSSEESREGEDDWDRWIRDAEREEHAAALQALARVRFAQDRAKDAAALQREAIARLEGSGYSAYLADMRKTLERYGGAAR